MSSASINKTCFICGLDKPMTAFLQISGPEGTTYGNTCSTCRGSGLGKKITLTEGEGAGSSSTGVKIDSKAKMKYDTDIKKDANLQKVLDEKEQQKKEDIKEDLGERKEETAKREKKHRAEYIEKKKEGFLSYHSKKPERSESEINADAQRQQTATDESINREKGQISENFNKADADVKHQERTGINLANIYIDPNIAGQVRHQSVGFLQAKKALLGGAAMTTFERQLEKMQTAEAAKRDIKIENSPAKEGEKPQAVNFSQANELSPQQASPPTQHQATQPHHTEAAKPTHPAANAPTQPHTPAAHTPATHAPVTHAPATHVPAAPSSPTHSAPQQHQEVAMPKLQIMRDFLNRNLPTEKLTPPAPKTPSSGSKRGR